MKHYLSGIALPILTEVGFGLPFFSRPGSNELFSQIIGPEGAIAGFASFDPTPFNKRLNVSIEHRAVGEEALWAFASSTDTYVAERSSLAQQLRHLDLTDWPFTAVDVADFVGDRVSWTRAIAVAAAKLSRPEVVQIWSRTQSALVRERFASRKKPPRHQLQLPDKLKASIEELRNQLGHPDWGSLWLKHRRVFGRTAAAEELAAVWIEQRPWNEHSAGEVLATLLRSPRLRDRVSRLARDWLAIATFDNPYWPRVWSRTPQAPLDDLLKRLAFEYLDHATPTKVAASSWIRVWRMLFIEEPNPLLVAVSITAFLSNNSEHSKLLNQVMPLARKESAHAMDAIDAIVRDWLRTKPRNRNWARVYKRQLDQLQNDIELRQIGRAFLKSSAEPISSWATVWNALVKSDAAPHDLFILGNQWLKATPNTTPSWRLVARSLLRRMEMSTDLIWLAEDAINAAGSNGQELHNALNYYLNNSGHVEETSVTFDSGKNPPWIQIVKAMVRQTGGNEFTLTELYAFEPSLKQMFPRNKNIRAKIRQQLQILRDKKEIAFAGRGRYVKATSPIF